ncbi:MAG: hypothetical protein R2750_01835 [Bacteroidales bacterium]
MEKNNLKHSKCWKNLFFFGIIILLFLEILIFGIELLSIITALFTILSIVINILFSPNEYQNGDNWLKTKLHQAFNITQFLKVTTVIIWSILFVLLSYASYKMWIKNKQITLAGNILKPNGEVLNGASLKLYNENIVQITETKDGGKFNILVDSRDIKSDSIKLEVTWGTVKYATDIDLSFGTQKNLIIKLPLEEKPYRLSYFYLKGHTIDFLFEDKISNNWEELLSNGPIIIQNNVYKEISTLLDRFTRKPLGDNLYYLSIKKKSANGTISEYNVYQKIKESEIVFQPEILKWAKEKRFLVGTEDSDYNLENSIDFFPTEEVSNKIFEYVESNSEDFDAEWLGEIKRKNGTFCFDGFSFRKYANINDLMFLSEISGNTYFNDHIEFYKYITRNYLPNDFLPFTFSNDSHSCSDPELAVSLIPPDLQIKVCLIENISSSPIRIDHFTLKENNSYSLHNETANTELLDSILLEKKILFPQKLLLPKEKLIIPIEIFFKYSLEDSVLLPLGHINGENNTLNTFLDTHIIDTNDILLNYNIYDFPYVNQYTYKFKSSSFHEIVIPKMNTDSMLNKKFFYGPSILLEELEIDNITYPIRKHDPNSLVIQNGYPRGSCPFIYTFNTEEKMWILEDHILEDFKGVNKFGFDEIELNRFDGRILIKEIAQETSFIDYLFIKIIDIDGVQHILLPINSKLQSEDGIYLIINEEETMKVEFENMSEELQPVQVYLNAKGYYVPN